MRDYDDTTDKKYRKIKRNIKDNEKITYIDHVRNVMGEVYKNNKCPRRVDYEKAVLEVINADRADKQKYELKDIHSSVYKAINKLLKFGEMKDDDKFVYPNNSDYKRTVFIEDFANIAYVKHNKPFFISSRTIAIALKNNISIDDVIKKIRDYIGESHCFSIATLDNYPSEISNPVTEASSLLKSQEPNYDPSNNHSEKVIIIMLYNYDSVDDLKQSVNNITIIVNEVYNKQNIVTPPVDPFKKARDEKRAAKRAEKKCQEAKKNGISPVKS